MLKICVYRKLMTFFLFYKLSANGFRHLFSDMNSWEKVFFDVFCHVSVHRLCRGFSCHPLQDSQEGDTFSLF